MHYIMILPIDHTIDKRSVTSTQPNKAVLRPSFEILAIRQTSTLASESLTKTQQTSQAKMTSGFEFLNKNPFKIVRS